MEKDFDNIEPVKGHVWDRLSAYMDDHLEPDEKQAVREHLEACADCRAEYIELRATRHVLRSLPTVPPPRAFTLTPEMVAPVPGFWQRLLAPRNSPRFATGSVLAFAMLFFVLATAGPLGQSANMAAPPVESARYSSSQSRDSVSRQMAADQTPAALDSSVGVAKSLSEPTATSGDVAVGGISAGQQPPADTPALESQPDSVWAVGAGPALTITEDNAYPLYGTQTTTISDPLMSANRDVDATDTSSPDTLGLRLAPEAEEQRQSRTSQGPSTLFIIEASLALLGVALALAALLARR